MTQAKADLLQGDARHAHSESPQLRAAARLRDHPAHSPNVRRAEVEQGSLYPALYRIEQRGWVSSKWELNETGRRAKFYTLTKAGSKQLAVEEKSWDLLALAIAKVRKAV